MLDAQGIAAVSKEKVSMLAHDHPARKLAKGTKWMQPAVKKMKEKGTEGSLTRIAKEHGQTAMGFAHQHLHDKAHPKWAKKSLFAVNANKGR